MWFIILPVIKELKYCLMLRSWKRDIFSMEFIKDVFNNIIDTIR